MKKSRAVDEIRAFNRFYTTVIGVMNRHFLESTYSLTEVRIMFEVFHDPTATVRKIKTLLKIDEGYLSRTIDKLVTQGLVSKTQSKVDRRSYILSLSSRGKREFLKLNERQEQSVESMINHLSSEGLDELISIMHRIKDLLTKQGENR
jgi:DNA-binding MarR family transcriptional regulator